MRYFWNLFYFVYWANIYRLYISLKIYLLYKQRSDHTFIISKLYIIQIYALVAFYTDHT